MRKAPLQRPDGRRLGGARGQPEGDDRRKGLGQLRDRSLAVEAAPVHEADAVGPLLRLFQVVRGEHDRGPVSRRPSTASQSASRDWMSSPVVGSSRITSSGPPYTAVAKSRRRFSPPESWATMVLALRVRPTTPSTRSTSSVATTQGADQGDRLLHREVRGEAALLQHDPHPGPDGMPVLGARAEDPHRAGGGPAVPFDDLQGGGLACSVRAEQGIELPAFDLEATGHGRRRSRRR